MEIYPRHVEALRAICGSDHVYTREEISSDYSHDELAYTEYYPDLLVEPGSTEEVARVLEYAYAHDLPVVPRGNGTGLCGGAVAIHGGIILSTARLNQILEIDEDNLMAVVQPGVILLDLQKTVEAKGLFYPPDPGEKSGTLGGNVATNAGGMRAVAYGVTRDYVLGLEVVLPDGRIIEVGGKVVKNSSGYSLLHLFVGSEGTLGVITKIILRLIPKPARQVSLLVPFPDLERAIEAVPKILREKVVPASMEFMQQEVIQAAAQYLGKPFPDSSAPAYLLLTFYGNTRAEMEEVYHRAAQVCLDVGAYDVLIADILERQAGIWETRGTFLEAIKALGEMDEVDVVLPPHSIAAFIKYSEEIGRSHGVRILSFGHAGDGNLHVYLFRGERSQKEWEAVHAQVMELLYDEAKRLGGQVSGEHGIGYAKKPYLASSLGPTQMDLLRSIKRVFDPKGLLNPGKIID
ncbi:MAG: FAD-binding oxidoreductase [Limnochordia bacterium]|jgi:glycolate oxidase